jgi:predicted MFS family arabinose efflux permease
MTTPARQSKSSSILPSKSDQRLYIGVAFATTLGHAGLVSLPFEIGAIIDGLKISTAAGGLLVTVELLAYALTNILLAPIIGRMSTRRIAQIGTLLVIGADLLSALTANLPIFTLARGIAGIGFGIVFACANVAGATAKSPERAYAVGLGVSILFYAVLPTLLAYSLNLADLAPTFLYPHSGVFLAVIAFAIVMLPTMNMLPLEPTQSKPTQSKGPETKPHAGQKATMAAFLSILLMLCFALGVFCIYTYIERRARILGMSSENIGLLISFGFATGMAGTVLAGWVGRRFGMIPPLVIGMVLQGVSCLVLAIGDSQIALWGSVILFQIMWYFLYPYVFGIAAEIDPVGRLVTAVGGVYLIGAAIAASIGGYVVQYGGFAAVGTLSLALCSVGALTCLPLSRVLARAKENQG